jgi:hypothetical protein
MTDPIKPDTWREFVAANGIVDPITDEHVERFAEHLWAQFNKRIDELEDQVMADAHLSRGVFVRELSHDELGNITADVRRLPGIIDVIRACIAEATKLPKGAQRFTQPISAAGVLGPGVFHVVFVPEGE